jgi:hypothetical protein
MPILASTEAGRDLIEPQLYWSAMQFVTLATDGNRYLSLNGRRSPDQRKALADRVTCNFLYGHRKLR